MFVVWLGGAVGGSNALGDWLAAAAGSERPDEEILQLERRRKELRAERSTLSRDLRIAEKRRTRLVEKARRVSDADLMNILSARAAAKAKSQAKGNKIKHKRSQAERVET